MVPDAEPAQEPAGASPRCAEWRFSVQTSDPVRDAYDSPGIGAIPDHLHLMSALQLLRNGGYIRPSGRSSNDTAWTRLGYVKQVAGTPVDSRLRTTDMHNWRRIIHKSLTLQGRTFAGPSVIRRIHSDRTCACSFIILLQGYAMSVMSPIFLAAVLHFHLPASGSYSALK